uniref:Uncharacterized protein n=1 Tax=Xiphophorus couchianus TaxID=32473 RepID=A0A3B5MP37_9TELE
NGSNGSLSSNAHPGGMNAANRKLNFLTNLNNQLNLSALFCNYLSQHHHKALWMSLKVLHLALSSNGGLPKIVVVALSPTTLWSASKLDETAGKSWVRLVRSPSTGTQM